MKIQFITDSGNVIVWNNVPEDKLQSLLNVRQCAELLGIKEGTVFSRIHRKWPVLLALATDEPKQ